MGNPLRQPKPSPQDVIYAGRFFPARENGAYESSAAFVRYNVRLTARQLWISPELSVPLEAIEETMIKKGPLRRGLGVTYINPITNQRESVFLCKLDPLGIGLYRLAPLQQLKRQIARARADLASTGAAPEGAVAIEPAEETAEDEGLRACEACGAKPAYYVAYTFLLGAFVFWYQSADERRVHCKKHVVLSGSWRYLLTAATGWAGLSIIAYPFSLYRTANNMKPAIGGLSYILALLPLPIVAYVVWKLIEALGW